MWRCTTCSNLNGYNFVTQAPAKVPQDAEDVDTVNVDTVNLDSSDSDPEDSTQQGSVSCGYFVSTQSAHHANWDGLRTV